MSRRRPLLAPPKSSSVQWLFVSSFKNVLQLVPFSVDTEENAVFFTECCFVLRDFYESGLREE